jgi:hypothetical protein
MEKIAKEVCPEVSLLKQVKGVGTQIALTYVLTIEDPYRFPKSRAVGCFLGLRPGRSEICFLAPSSQLLYQRNLGFDFHFVLHLYRPSGDSHWCDSKISLL